MLINSEITIDNLIEALNEEAAVQDLSKLVNSCFSIGDWSEDEMHDLAECLSSESKDFIAELYYMLDEVG